MADSEIIVVEVHTPAAPAVIEIGTPAPVIEVRTPANPEVIEIPQGPRGPQGPQGIPGIPGVFVPLVSTFDAIGDPYDAINLTGKVLGLPVFLSDLGIPVWATGPLPDDPWVDALGNIIAPVDDDWILATGVWRAAGIWTADGIWRAGP